MTDAEIIARIPEDVREMARERAASGGWPEPVSPGDYLMWIQDEAGVQGDTGNGGCAMYLTSVSLVLLHAYGIVPSQAPWLAH